MVVLAPRWKTSVLRHCLSGRDLFSTASSLFRILRRRFSDNAKPGQRSCSTAGRKIVTACAFAFLLTASANSKLAGLDPTHAMCCISRSLACACCGADRSGLGRRQECHIRKQDADYMADTPGQARSERRRRLEFAGNRILKAGGPSRITVDGLPRTAPTVVFLSGSCDPEALENSRLCLRQRVVKKIDIRCFGRSCAAWRFQDRRPCV
jgi:hypothetical protein